MRIATCQIGGSLQLGEKTGITLHVRQGERILFGAWSPPGIYLTLGDEAVHTVSARQGVWRYVFWLNARQRFRFGQYEFRIWLPGEVVELAADCLDSLHVGVDSALPMPPLVYVPPSRVRRGRPPATAMALLPAWSPTAGAAAYRHERGA